MSLKFLDMILGVVHNGAFQIKNNDFRAQTAFFNGFSRLSP